MTLKIGSNNISDVYFGNQKIKAIFCGSQLVFKKHEEIKHTLTATWRLADTNPTDKYSQYPAYEYFRGIYADDDIVVANGSTVAMLTISLSDGSMEWGDQCSVLKISGFGSGNIECYGYAGSAQTSYLYYADKTVVEVDGSYTINSASVQLSKTPSWCVWLNNQVLSLTNEGSNRYLYRLGNDVILERNKNSEWFVGMHGYIYIIDGEQVNRIDDSGSVENLYTGSISGSHEFLSQNEELYSIVTEWLYNEQNEYVYQKRLRKVNIEHIGDELENPWQSEPLTSASGLNDISAKFIGLYNEYAYVMVYPDSSNETDKNIEVLKIDSDGKIVARFSNILDGYPNTISSYNTLGVHLLPIPQESLNGKFVIGKRHRTGSSSDLAFYTYVTITVDEEYI